MLKIEIELRVTQIRLVDVLKGDIQNSPSLMLNAVIRDGKLKNSVVETVETIIVTGRGWPYPSIAIFSVTRFDFHCLNLYKTVVDQLIGFILLGIESNQP